MSMKTLATRITSKVGRQVLVAQKHSPVMLLAVGVVGFGTTVVLACQATLKLEGVLDKTNEGLVNAEEDGETSDEISKIKFGIKLKTAINVAKLYGPAAVVGAVSFAALTGSHVIMNRRNVGLTAAYAVVHKTFEEYRGRVVADQGVEKDFEYRFGTVEREIVEEGPNGPEVRIIKGLDADAIKKNGPSMYSRIFDETNKNWSQVPHQNQFLVQSTQNYANDKLIRDGHVFLNDVYDMLGMERSQAGSLVGWVSNSESGDRFIDFGVWNNGTFAGKEWVTGNSDAIMLDFNVDGVVWDLLDRKV